MWLLHPLFLPTRIAFHILGNKQSLIYAIILFDTLYYFIDRYGEMHLPTSGSFSKCLPQQGRSQTNAGSGEHNLGRSSVWQGLNQLNHHLCLPQSALAGSWIGSAAGT